MPGFHGRGIRAAGTMRLAGPDRCSSIHHQVFAFFTNTALGAKGAKAHLKDELI